MFRTSIAIWDKLSASVMKATSADSFYSMMSILTVNLFDKNVLNENDFMVRIYSYGPFPLSGLEEMREKLTFNISPFQENVNERSNGGVKGIGKVSRSGSIGLSSLKLGDGDRALIPGIDDAGNTGSLNGELSLRKINEGAKASRR